MKRNKAEQQLSELHSTPVSFRQQANSFHDGEAGI